VVVTGGEPMLQKDLVTKLAEMHPEWNWEIETNGTIMPTEYMLEHFQFNCSPKLENSNNIKAMRIHSDVLRAINSAPRSAFKFVVMTDNDLEEIQRDFLDTGLISVSKVILMPQGITPEELRKHMLAVAETAKEKGFRMLTRLQTEIWGTRRRV
jgi:organic radical activating enzyme